MADQKSNFQIRKSVEIQQVQETNPVLAKRGFGQWIPQGPFGRTMFLLACISLVTHGMPMTWRNVYNNRLRKLQAAGEGDEDEIEDKPEKGYGLGEESVDRPV